MRRGTGPRTRAERDTITVEIGYALTSAAFVAAAAFGGVICPLFFFDIPRPAGHLLITAGELLAAVVFATRVVHVLWRFGGRPAQPSQPGRTKPDS
ncbi:DUF6332 family protein [Streptomyces sp. NBC_00344]|uniref:DUF6332 family protein n=1 Tax=Streptomyces sp. NBC_00344 TaxID=2975720 RepID=UPI002E20BC59